MDGWVWERTEQDARLAAGRFAAEGMHLVTVQQPPAAQPPPVSTTTTTASPYAATTVGGDRFSERTIEKRPNRALLSTGVGVFVLGWGAVVERLLG